MNRLDKKTKLPRYQANAILCSHCHTYKSKEKFNPSCIDHKHYVCADCLRNYRKKRVSNINRLIDNMYYHQINSKSDVLYSWEQFSTWLLQQSSFISLYELWIDSKLNKKFTPSVVRKDSKKPFSINNLKITTSCMSKLNSSRTRARCVIQMDENNQQLAKYPNSRIAAEMLNYKHYVNIHSVCNNIKKHAAGFKWKYA